MKGWLLMKVLTPQIIYTLIFACGITIIFLALRHKINKGSNKSKEALDHFLIEEHRANFITKKNLPNELLLHIDSDQIPPNTSTECEGLFQQVVRQSTLPMVNLSQYTNLQLKQTFGVNHLDTLIQYEQNYISFLQTLTAYGIALHNAGYIQDSIQSLEYCLNFGCDLNKCYLYLIKNYGIINNKASLMKLKEHLKVHPPLGKELIEEELQLTLQSRKK